MFCEHIFAIKVTSACGKKPYLQVQFIYCFQFKYQLFLPLTFPQPYNLKHKCYIHEELFLQVILEVRDLLELKSVFQINHIKKECVFRMQIFVDIR